MKPLISVIVPCYNVERYIDRCISSLVNQTIGLENLQLIFVDDASHDTTYEKLLQWEKKYPEQILVIGSEGNRRQGGARNMGMQYAAADYIGFVDSDDWVEPDMYELLYEIAVNGDYDVVSGKMVWEEADAKTISESSIQENQVYHFEKRGQWYAYDVDKTGNVGLHGGIVTRLLKRKLIMDNQIWFPEHIAYEDNYWWNILSLYIKDEYILDKIVYHYMINAESTTLSRNAPYQLDRLTIEVAIIEEYKRIGAFSYFHDRLEYGFVLRFYLNTLFILFTRFDDGLQVFSYMKKTVLSYFPDYASNPAIQRLDPLNQQLLCLLDMEGEPDKDQLLFIKEAYLQAIRDMGGRV